MATPEIISVVIAILALAVPLWRSRQKYALRWGRIRPKSMMDIADEIASDVTISFKGRQIENLTRFQFVLHNAGFTALDGQSLVTPLSWEGPGSILSARVVETDPPVELILSVDANRLEIRWRLFNQKCKALIEVLCEGGSEEERGHLTGQIRNIPKVEEKGLPPVFRHWRNSQTNGTQPWLAA